MNDPLMAPLSRLMQLPVIPARAWAEQEADRITAAGITVAQIAVDEADKRSQAQLAAVAQSLQANAVSLIAYARGKIPRVERAEPNTNIIVSS